MTDQSELNTTPETTEFDTLLDMASQLDEQAKLLRTRAAELRKTAKVLQKQLKTAQAKSGKRKRVKDPNAPKRQPAGFAKPTALSPELCKFLSIDEGTQIARTDVTKQITQYIKANNLQNPSNKREILLDGPMKALLNPPADVVVTFFTLQTYLKHHFPSNKGSDSTSTSTKEVVPAKPVVAKPETKSLDKKKMAVKKKLETGGRQRISA